MRWLNHEKPLVKPLKKNQGFLRAQKFRAPTGMHPRKFGKDSLRDPQPLIDIFQEENSVTVIAEIAGFNKETLKIDVKDQKLTLSAKAKDRRYYKSLNLPKEVIPDIFHTAYKNGVLEIKLKKARSAEAIKKQIR